MARVQMVALEDSFDANATFIPAGQIGSFDTDRLNGKEALVPGDQLPPIAAVEISPISPTGPNPVNPQQLPAGATQAAGGSYVAEGVRFVGEKTLPADVRLSELTGFDDTSQGDLAEQLRVAREELAQLRGRQNQEQVARDTGQPVTATLTQNDDDELVSGTVADITASLGGKTDDELEALRAAEVDRERPRKGVLDAIKAEKTTRAA